MLIPEMIEYMEAENERIKKLHLTEMENDVYKIFGIVTNMIEKDGGELVCTQMVECAPDCSYNS